MEADHGFRYHNNSVGSMESMVVRLTSPSVMEVLTRVPVLNSTVDEWPIWFATAARVSTRVPAVKPKMIGRRIHSSFSR